MFAIRSGFGRIAALTGPCFGMLVGKRTRVCMTDCLSLSSPGNFSWRGLLAVLVFLASFGPVSWPGGERWAGTAVPSAFAQGEGDSCPAGRTVDVEEDNCRTAGVAAAVCSRFCFDALRNDLSVRIGLRTIQNQDFENLWSWLNDMEPRFEATVVRHHDQFCAERSGVSDDVFETTDLPGLTPVDASASTTPQASDNRWWWYDIKVIIREDGKVGCRASIVKRASENVYSPPAPSDQVEPVISDLAGDGYHICR